MAVLDILQTEFLGFFGLGSLIALIESGDYSSLRTLQGVGAVIAPIIPFLLVFEFVRGWLRKKPQMRVYRVNFLIFVINRVIGTFIALAAIGLVIGYVQPLAPFQIDFTWYGFIYGYIIWELGHFIYHYLGHKVRLFWCVHSTHHAPEDMNLSVSWAHFFLEAPYADIIRTSVCMIAGLPPEMLFAIMLVDGFYGAYIHIGENISKEGKLGFLTPYILTPSHHRVHHARNPLYMDRNFCNLLNIWDRVFGTYQEAEKDIKIDYGISRPINSGSFFDVYFGEIVALAKDVRQAPRLIDKLKYIFAPPGWSHLGEHKTARIVREQYLADTATAQA